MSTNDWSVDPHQVVRVNTGPGEEEEERGLEVPLWGEGKKRLGIKTMNDGFDYLAPYVVEFIGTFFLTLTIGFNVVLFDPLAPLAVGSVLMALVFYGGHISGAHYNPAVTLGAKLTFRDHIGWRKSAFYVVVQFFGGFCAGLVYWGITSDTFTFGPGSGYDTWQATLVEFIYTFLLVSVMINTTTTQSQAGNSFFGLAIGFTVLAAAFSVGPISGAALNPAVATGAILVDLIHYNGGSDHVEHIWIYWVGPFCGGILAAIIFRVTNAKEFKKRRLDDKEWRSHTEEKENNGTPTKYYDAVQDRALST